jgi:hypothetical protein
MQRSTFLAIIAAVSLLALAGCSTTIGAEDRDETVLRESNNVTVKNLEVYAQGDRSCYHTFDATVSNNNTHSIENVKINIEIYSENDQILSKFTTGYTGMAANETKELNVEHGPQKNQCWPSSDADDYSVNIIYNTTS